MKENMLLTIQQTKHSLSDVINYYVIQYVAKFIGYFYSGKNNSRVTFKYISPPHPQPNPQ